jgi:TATA-binding protein-associated factor
MPFLADSKTLINRLGASEAVYQILELMKDDVLPYIVFLIVPILKRMSDPDPNVRFLCSNIFAKLVKLVPLEKGIPNPDGFSPEMIKQREDERKFMGQLVGSERMEDFSLNVDIAAELRPYQKDGVNWLAFLNRYGLHGILCDGRTYSLIR